MASQGPKLYIGTSGWNYKSWKDTFYSGVKQKQWLEYYTNKFNAVEVNATFYRLLKESTIKGWQERTPEEFYFAVKGSRYTTHTKRLKDSWQSIAQQQKNIDHLGDKLVAVIWQMPGSMQKDMERLQNFCKALNNWEKPRHAVEFRHTSWFDDQVAELLSSYKIAICISDAASWPKWDKVSTDLVYIRLHGNVSTYHSSYSEKELRSWANRILNWLQERRTVHIYFDNTNAGAAPENAIRLKELLS